MTTQVNVDEARRLGRIHSGKDPAPGRYEEKLKEVTLKMDLERIQKELEELRTNLPKKL
jgi:hypothetical protein